MMIDLIGNEAVALGLSSILRGEFLPDFHQFDSSASLLLMKRSCCGGFSSYGFHDCLSCRVAYESFSRVMIG